MHIRIHMYIAIYMYMEIKIFTMHHFILLCIGVLKSSGDKVTMKFHTSIDKEPKVYTITTVGETDTVLSLLG